MPMQHINIASNAYHKIMGYVQNTDAEVSGFGKCARIKVGGTWMYHMTDVRIFEQVCMSVHTELDIGGLAQFLCDIDKDGEDISDWPIWWHSHNNFGVFFSAIDEDTIKKLCKKKRLISLCVNKLGEMIARLDRGKNTYKLTVVSVPPSVGEVNRLCKAEVKQKVKIEKGGISLGRRCKEVVLEAVGLGESAEDSLVQDFRGRSRSDRELRGALSYEDGMQQYYGI